MTVSELVRGQPAEKLARIFGPIAPSHTECISVGRSRWPYLVSRDPWAAGVAYHNLLLRWGDEKPFTKGEAAYYGWMKAMRTALRRGRSPRFHVEVPMTWGDYHGRCDIAIGGKGLAEVKVSDCPAEKPRAKDVGQLAIYCAGLKAEYGALVYVQLREQKVVVHWFFKGAVLVKGAGEMIHGRN